MRRTPLFSGFIYMLLGCLFTYFAIQDVRTGGWNIFTAMWIVLATFDFGSGLKMILFYFKFKDKLKK